MRATRDENLSKKSGFKRGASDTNCSQVRVGPSMGTKLVTLSNMLDLRLVVIDAVPIHTVDEERSLSTGVVEGVGDVGHVLVRAVIEGEGSCVGHSARIEGHSGALEEWCYSNVGRNRFRFGYRTGKDGQRRR